MLHPAPKKRAGAPDGLIELVIERVEQRRVVPEHGIEGRPAALKPVPHRRRCLQVARLDRGEHPALGRRPGRPPRHG
jgi:hypothetical protein